MIALIKKFILSKIASIIGSGNMKQIETLITIGKQKSKKTKKKISATLAPNAKAANRPSR